MYIGDLIILNILYLICCIPIFTIGAAQAGLYTGIRVLQDPEDDSPVYKAFFKGFASGFKTITVANLILLVILAGFIALLAYTLTLMLAGGSKLSFIICVVAASLVYIVHSILGPFHATFGCSVGQLIRNSFFMLVAYPIRSLVTAVLVLLPLAILMIWPQVILGGIIGFLGLYYSVAYLGIFSLMKKPFQRLKDSFYKAQNAENEEASSPTSDESDEEPSEE